MRIETMRTVFSAADHEVSAPAFAANVLARQKADLARRIAAGEIVPTSVLNVTLPSEDLVIASPVAARVNHGRWIADCECGGAEYVDMERPLFMCASCWNELTGGAWRPVAVPPTWRLIEEALLARPEARTRNWRPAESVADLERENAERGLPARREERP